VDDFNRYAFTDHRAAYLVSDRLIDLMVPYRMEPATEGRWRFAVLEDDAGTLDQLVEDAEAALDRAMRSLLG